METPVNPPVESKPVPKPVGYDPSYSEKVYSGATKLLGDKYPQLTKEQFDKNLHNPLFVKGLYDQIQKTGKATNLPDFKTFSQKVTPSIKEKPRNWLDKSIGDLSSITDIPSENELNRTNEMEYAKILRNAKDTRVLREKIDAYQPKENTSVAPSDATAVKDLRYTGSGFNTIEPDVRQKYEDGLRSFVKDAADRKLPIRDHVIRVVNNIADYALSDSEKLEFSAIKRVETMMPYYREALKLEEQTSISGPEILGVDETMPSALVGAETQGLQDDNQQVQG